MAGIMETWDRVFKKRDVLHRVFMRPGRGDDGKPSMLGQIRRRIFGMYWRWNWVDNPRRAAMHRFVSHFYEAEKALAEIKEHERENQSAEDAAQHERWSEGKSAPYPSKRIPREVGLIPIPPEFKDLKKRFEKGASNDDRERMRAALNKDGDITRFIPSGMSLPSIMLQGKVVKDWRWDVDRGKNRQQQRGKRSRGKGGGNQPQSHEGEIHVHLDGDNNG